MKRSLIMMSVPVLLLGLMLAGCGGGVDEQKPISDVKAEAQGMSADQLRNMAAKYEEAIEARKADIEKLTADLQKIPVAQMLGDEANAIKDEITNISNSVRALNERMNIYLQQLRSQQG
jgi:gas vesicle protein